MAGGIELLTFGHGAATADRIGELLRGADVRLVVDIRTAPGSRRHPHVARTALEQWLPHRGIGYRWENRLGGWRTARPDSPDTALRDRAFAGYAAHMRTPEFRAAVDQLLRDAASHRTTVLCAESVWWRCHRQFLADFVVLARGQTVLHLLHDGALKAHPPNDLARLHGPDDLVYDAGQTSWL
jgi:uncharacterized protein (DUF488 family)